MKGSGLRLLLKEQHPSGNGQMKHTHRNGQQTSIINKSLTPSCSLSPPWFCLLQLLLTDTPSAVSVTLISSLFWQYYQPSRPGDLCAEASCPAESSVFQFNTPHRSVRCYTAPQSVTFLDKQRLEHFYGIQGSPEEVNQDA